MVVRVERPLLAARFVELNVPLGAHSGCLMPHKPRLWGVKIDQSTASDSNFFTANTAVSRLSRARTVSRSLRERSFGGYRRQ